MPPQVQYKKGHNERKAKYTSLPDPPEVVLAKTVDQQRSDVSCPNLLLGSGFGVAFILRINLNKLIRDAARKIIDLIKITECSNQLYIL